MDFKSSLLVLLISVSCHMTLGNNVDNKETCSLMRGGGYKSCRAENSPSLSSSDASQEIRYSVTIQDLNMWSLVCCRARACSYRYADDCSELKYLSMGCGRTSFAKTLTWGSNSGLPELQCKSSSRDVSIKWDFIPVGGADSRYWTAANSNFWQDWTSCTVCVDTCLKLKLFGFILLFVIAHGCLCLILYKCFCLLD